MAAPFTGANHGVTPFFAPLSRPNDDVYNASDT
jgi:hypothetical protein